MELEDKAMNHNVIGCNSINSLNIVPVPIRTVHVDCIEQFVSVHSHREIRFQLNCDIFVLLQIFRWNKQSQIISCNLESLNQFEYVNGLLLYSLNVRKPQIWC